MVRSAKGTTACDSAHVIRSPLTRRTSAGAAGAPALRAAHRRNQHQVLWTHKSRLRSFSSDRISPIPTWSFFSSHSQTPHSFRWSLLPAPPRIQ